MDRNKLQQQNFDEQDITSGFIMNLIKLTQQNIRLGKQQQTNGEKNGTVQYMATDSTIKR